MPAVTLRGHTRNVNCVAAFADVVLSGSDDNTVKVWRGNKCVRTIKAHKAPVRALAVLPGGGRFVSVSVDCTA